MYCHTRLLSSFRLFIIRDPFLAAWPHLTSFVIFANLAQRTRLIYARHMNLIYPYLQRCYSIRYWRRVRSSTAFIHYLFCPVTGMLFRGYLQCADCFTIPRDYQFTFLESRFHGKIFKYRIDSAL